MRRQSQRQIENTSQDDGEQVNQLCQKVNNVQQIHEMDQNIEPPSNSNQNKDQQDLIQNLRSKSKHYNQHREPTNFGIIIYTIFTMFSCVYLEVKFFAPFIQKQSFRQLCIIFSISNVIFCFWSYIQTIRYRNTVLKMKKLPPSYLKTYVDKSYNLIGKQCEPCGYFKMPRMSHCRTCGSCIYKLDHHCMWAQNCIGYQNQKCFYLFTLYMSVGTITFWYYTYNTLTIIWNTGKLWHSFQPGIYIWWGVTCLSAGFVGIMIVTLFLSHTFLILTNYTTLDTIKTKRMCMLPFIEWRPSLLQNENINIYDRGEIQNVGEIFGKNIVTFLLPTSRELHNEFIVQKQHPYPSSWQLQEASGLSDLVNGEKKRDAEVLQIVKNIKSIFKGYRFKVKDQIILI